MARMIDGNPDRKYYNISIANNENNSTYTYATYKENLNQQLLSNPSDYYLTILRFQIPTADIPILIPEIEAWPNTDVNKTVYNVTLEYRSGATTYTATAPVIYIPNVPPSYAIPRPITADDPNPMKNPSNYYFIFNYRDFIDMVNNAFIAAFTDLSGQIALPPGTNPPFITYNGQTYLMTMHASPSYLTPAYSTPPPPQSGQVNIYMNYKLFTFFSGIEFILNDYLSPKGVQLPVRNYNGVNFDGTNYLMAQQYPTLSVWNVFKAIQIVSFFLPTEPEIIPIPNYNGINSATNTYNTTSVVKDFVPFYENGPEFRTFINFRYNGSYELIDMNSNSPINTVDINVYWLDRYGNKYLLSIPYNQILTIKFCFIKKSTFTG